MKRNEFIKLGTYATLAILFSDCNSDENNNSQAKNISVDSIPPLPNTSTTVFNNFNLQIIKKGDEEYDTLRVSYNKRLNKYPEEIIICRTTEDVSHAILYAKHQKKQVTVKSGGHCFEGYCMDDKCILIYLSYMNKIEWIDENTIAVEPGTRLIDVYNTTLEKGKILPAGSCGSVGVAGLTLGGGYGFFGRKYGMTCDSLEEVTMVDGNGNILNSKTNSEILWACKGGNNGHLGIVTQLKFKLHEAPSSFKITQFHSNDTSVEFISSFLKKYISIAEQLNNDAFISFFIRKNFVAIRLFEFGKSNLKMIDGELQTLKLTKRNGFNEPLKKAMNRMRGSAKPLFFKNASCSYFNKWEDIENSLVSSLQFITQKSGVLFQINSLGGNIKNEQFEIESAYPHRSYNFLCELQTYWETEPQMEEKVNIFKSILQNFEKEKINAQYVNYPCNEFVHYNEAYYGKNLLKLQLLKSKYDANNIFYSPQGLQVEKIIS